MRLRGAGVAASFPGHCSPFGAEEGKGIASKLAPTGKAYVLGSGRIAGKENPAEAGFCLCTAYNDQTLFDHLQLVGHGQRCSRLIAKIFLLSDDVHRLHGF